MKTVTCNGCFDGLHPGHMFYLGFCRGQGDELVVGINSDGYIRRTKEREPVSEAQRVEDLMSLGFIRDVVVFLGDEPSLFIKSIRPDVNCIGEEYKGSAPEEKICRELGIEMVYVPRVGNWSSTSLRASQP